MTAVQEFAKPKYDFNADKVQATAKHGGGGVIVRGCMASPGVGKLVFIDRIIDKMVSLDILKNNFRARVQRLNLEANWRFQQNSNPKHSVVKQWIVYNAPHTLPALLQYPDMSPMEHL